LKVPLLDLRKQYEKIKDEIMEATEEVYESQRFIQGPKVEELESLIAEYCGCRYAVGVSSGTDALLISLMTAGVGRNDLVITTPYTFFATIGSIVRVGAVPLMVDIEDRTFNMNPLLLEQAVTSLDGEKRRRLKAIIPIHLFGQCADMDPIMKVAAKNDLIVIEDAAQAIGAEYQYPDGRKTRAGSMGQYGCFSFFPSKNLGAFGDGGMVTTNNPDIHDRLKIYREHGSKPKYFHRFIGGNFRLDALQAAILIVKFRHLDDWTEKRIANANLYRKLLHGVNPDELFLPPEKETRHIYNQFVIRLKTRRDALKEFLNERKIGCEIYYPVPLHRQECFRYLNLKENDFPASVKAASESLAIPIYPDLETDQIVYITDNIKDFLEKP
jgi:dTDP-4-amino-4,6-dideoxygalactose transaminase